jgi:hypothetical protein
MTFPTVTETTPSPEAVTPDTFLASGLGDRADVRARKAAATVPFLGAELDRLITSAR